MGYEVILFVRFLAVEVQTCFDNAKAYTSLLLDILLCFCVWVVFETRDSKGNWIPSVYSIRYYVPDIDGILYYVVVYYIAEG